MKKSKLILLFIASLSFTYIAAAIGAIGMGNSIAEWYPTLNAPFFKPPNWLFGPVWSMLYTLMAIAAFLVWKKGINTFGVKVSLSLYAIQLLLNSMWSIIFFRWHLLGFALFEILLLLFIIIITYINFKRVDKWAGYLLIPYILWVSFASLLNGAYWWLN
jgi:benzodiazapine receptor